MPVDQLVTWWNQARARTLVAQVVNGDAATVVADYWAKLALSTRIA
ncbi:hypothetical protein [Actinophytocola sp.]